MRKGVTGVGALLASGFLVASCAMNWRYGVSLGRTEIDQWTFGGISVVADLFKAMLPFYVSWSYRNRRLLVSVAAGALWILCVAYSITSALGFAALNRADTAAVRGDTIDRRQNLEQALETARARIKSLGQPQPSAAIEAKMASLRTNAKWDRTRRCTDVTLADSRKFCSKYQMEMAELAIAKEGERIRVEVSNIKGRLDALRTNGLQSKRDPQADIISRLLAVDVATVSTALAVLVAVLVELGSGLGLFIAFNHGGRPSSAGRWRKAQSAGPENGDVARYAVARLRFARGREVHLKTLYADYWTWCAEQGFRGASRRVFEDGFAALSEVVGLNVSDKAGQKAILDMELVG